MELGLYYDERKNTLKRKLIFDLYPHIAMLLSIRAK